MNLILIISIIIILLLCLYLIYLILRQICSKNYSNSFCSVPKDKSGTNIQSDYLKFNNNFEEK